MPTHSYTVPFDPVPFDLWIDFVDPPCEWCAVWIGPHRHLVADDGNVGAIITSIDEMEAARIRYRLAHPELELGPV